MLSLDHWQIEVKTIPLWTACQSVLTAGYKSFSSFVASIGNSFSREEQKFYEFNPIHSPTNVLSSLLFKDKKGGYVWTDCITIEPWVV